LKKNRQSLIKFFVHQFWTAAFEETEEFRAIKQDKMSTVDKDLMDQKDLWRLMVILLTNPHTFTVDWTRIGERIDFSSADGLTLNAGGSSNKATLCFPPIESLNYKTKYIALMDTQ